MALEFYVEFRCRTEGALAVRATFGGSVQQPQQLSKGSGDDNDSSSSGSSKLSLMACAFKPPALTREPELGAAAAAKAPAAVALGHSAVAA